MFDSGILDVGIGIAFVFILVSTLCSAIREGIESWLKTRATYLEYAIRELLNDPKSEGLAQEFFKHPLINGLFQGQYQPRTSQAKPSLWQRGRNLPSYIPARSFALTLIDLAGRGPVSGPHDGASVVSFDSLRASVGKLQNPAVERALASAIDSAQGDLDKVRQNLEAWYDGAMDRVSGWYKRSTQWIILVVAIGVAGALNVNTITIADSLYRNKALRDAAVAVAQRGEVQNYDDALTQFDRMRIPLGWGGGWGAPKNAVEKHVIAQRRSANGMASDANFDLWNDVFAPLLGLMITAFAATLGAPFWFDVLNKIMVIRATVKPHQKSPEEASEDRQAPALPAPAAVGVGSALGVSAAQAPDSARWPGAAPENDVDGCACDGPIENVTADEDLPHATGGVA
jgi:hypothetical protein